MDATYKLIVRRDYPLGNPDKGICRIIYAQRGDGQILLISELGSEFETEKIWISKGYELIESNYNEGELFLLENYHESDDKQSYEIDAKNHTKHWATGSSAKPLNANDFIPIYNCALPNLSTGIINLAGRPPRGMFFIQTEHSVIGPFTASKSDEDLIATPASPISLSIPNQHVLEVPRSLMTKHDVTIQNSDTSKPFTPVAYIKSITALQRINKDERVYRDYINDSQLVSFIAKHGLGKKNIIGRKSAEQLKAGIQEMLKKQQAASYSERITRLQVILDRYLSETDIGSDLINEFLSADTGKAFIKNQLETNPHLINENAPELLSMSDKVEALRAEISTLQSQHSQWQSKVVNISASVTSAQSEAKKQIEQIREQSKQEAEQERKKVNEALENEIEVKKSQSQSLDEECETLLDRLSSLKNYEALGGEVNYFERRKGELERAVQSQENKLRNPELPKELAELNTMIELLQGRSFNKASAELTFTKPRESTYIPESPEECIQLFVDEFERSDGRSFAYAEMANLLICSQQNFLTVLKGRPGTGKTSSVIRLAQAFKISGNGIDNQSDSFLNVAVSRGWMSGRDFLGFYNSLKDAYQPSKTGMYNYLRQADKGGAQDYLRLVLLDEANLSPIEHYWSDFLAMCDPEGRFRKIDTGMPGDKRYLSVPENIRFMATINNDNTTEPLSPRLCDRVPVITMDIANSSDDSVAATTQELSGSLPYKKLEEFFGRKNEDDTELPIDLTSFINIMLQRDCKFGSPINVSPRKLQAMKAYIDRATPLIGSRTSVDFALSQHALPLINGHGKPFRIRLEEMCESARTNSLERTARLLEEVIAEGDNYVGNYSFL